MAKGSNQKFKMLYILNLLREKTDDAHYIRMAEILDELQRRGIDAERKSVYDDISVLQDFGYNILRERGPAGGYCLAERHFQLAELKILVDAIQASKFITSKKSKDLIEKISRMTSVYEAKQLERHVYISDRIKTMNNSVYYNVDHIHQAVLQHKRIEFKYWEWTVRKEMQLKKEGADYEVSPWTLVWANDKYYLIAYEDSSGLIKHYRVDKMKDIRVTDKNRRGKTVFQGFNLEDYMKKTFNMYSGETKRLKIRFLNTMIGPVIDKFGSDATVKREGADAFVLRAEVAVSNQFFGWLSGLGLGARILQPAETAESYRRYLRNVLREYGDG
jgi:predicted DNA-binding transcriptional regulator YafY